MITDFADRRPALAALVIALLFTLVPGAILVAGELSGGENAAKLAFVCILVLQVILWLKVERPILTMFPFILSLLGLIVSEIVYTVSMGMAPSGAGPSALVLLLSSILVTIFGLVAVGSVGGLLAYGVIVIFRKLWELAAQR